MERVNLSELVRQTDSSLLEEWEALRHPGAEVPVSLPVDEAPPPVTNAHWTNEPFWHARRGDVWEGGGT